MIIHFVSVLHENLVHAGALGLTKMTYWFAWASTTQQAEQLCRAYCASIGAPIESVASCKPSVNQDLSRYVQPECILGLPAELLRQALAKKRYPPDWVDAAMRKAADRFRGCTVVDNTARPT